MLARAFVHLDYKDYEQPADSVAGAMILWRGGTATGRAVTAIGLVLPRDT